MNAFKLILLGGAGYLAYRRYFAPAETGPSGPATGTDGSTPPESPYPEPTLDTKGELVRRARQAGYTEAPLLLAYDQWNYFYQAIRGTSAGAWEDVVTGGADRSYRMTVDEFMTYLTARGLAGLIGVSR